MRDEKEQEGGLADEETGGGDPRADECPDANLLAAFGEGSLFPDEREGVREHWLGCDRCRDLVATLVRERRGRSFRDAPADWFRLRWRRAAATAVAVAAVVLGIVMLRRDAPPDTTGDLLVAASKDLAGSRPEVFADFEPFAAEELAALRGEVERGDVTLHEPAGKILSVNPGFEWSGAPGVREYDVVLYRPDRTEVWRAKSSESSMAWPAETPPLASGARYVWEVSGRGALGDAGGTRHFTTASAEEMATWSRAVDALAEDVDPSVAPLLRAHLALRRGLWLEAARAAREFAAARPDDPLGRATLEAVRRLLGEPEEVHRK